MDSNWPKKQSIANYLERWWVEGDRSRQSIRNDIEKGHLPGGKEPSGTWFYKIYAIRFINTDSTTITEEEK